MTFPYDWQDQWNPPPEAASSSQNTSSSRLSGWQSTAVPAAPAVPCEQYEPMREELDQACNSEGEAALEEERKTGKIVKCLIVRCTKTKNIMCHCVPYKGTGEDLFVASLVKDDIQWLGHVRMILKADNEPALKALIAQSLEEIRIRVEDLEQLTTEHRPRHRRASRAQAARGHGHGDR